MPPTSTVGGGVSKIVFSRQFAYNNEVMETSVNSYCLTKITCELKLKKRIEEVQKLKQANNKEEQPHWITNLVNVITFANVKANPSSEVELYWAGAEKAGLAKHRKLDLKEQSTLEPRIYEIVIIQRVFKTWLFLMKFKKEKAGRAKPKTYAGETKTEDEKLAEERRQIDREHFMEITKKKFKEFCVRMTSGEGFDVNLITPGASSLKRTKLEFKKDKRQIELPGEDYELKDIFEVSKGFSPKFHKFEVHRERCLHIKLVGDKTIEIEAKTPEDTGKLFEGFTELRNRLFTRFSFRLDDNGVSRRLSSTLIEEALKYEPKSKKRVLPAKNKNQLLAAVQSVEELKVDDDDLPGDDDIDIDMDEEKLAD